MSSQEILDTFYWKHGPSCAGCDWWRHHNAKVGECTKAAPVAAAERVAMLGIFAPSLHLGAGHVFTPHDHVCGDFRDEYDWKQLPLAYLCRIGAQSVFRGDQS